MTIQKQADLRRRFILWASSIGAVACLILSGIDLFRGGVEDTYWNLFYLGMIVAALGVYLLFESRIGWAILIASIPVVHHSQATADILLLAYFWVYPVPLLVFFVLGLRRGTPLIASLFTAIAGIAVWRAGDVGLAKEASDMVLSFGFVCSMSWLYEYMRNSHEQDLEDAMVTDELTGISNRRRFNEVLEDELKRCERYGGAFGLLVIDLDRFKQVNDSFGHPTGDRLLREFAKIVTEQLRETDYFARLGGDEFAVVAPELDGDSQDISAWKAVTTIADRLCTKVSEHDFHVDCSVTASIGATVYVKGDDSKSVFQRADDALYQAKEDGRNRFEVAA
ncbi:MAG: GGDEF domain-containing protein [Myxococcota bacterium]